MRQPPPVGVTCSGGAGWRLAGTLLVLGATASLLTWAFAHLEVQTPFGPLAAAGFALALAALAWRRLRERPRELRWDGSRWTLDGVEGAVQVMGDLGGWMLLRHRPAAGAAGWLPVAAAEAGPAWHGLRAALYAGPPVLSPPDGGAEAP